MEVQKSQKGADDIIMKRKIYQQLLASKGQSDQSPQYPSDRSQKRQELHFIFHKEVYK